MLRLSLFLEPPSRKILKRNQVLVAKHSRRFSDTPRASSYSLARIFHRFISSDLTLPSPARTPPSRKRRFAVSGRLRPTEVTLLHSALVQVRLIRPVVAKSPIAETIKNPRASKRLSRDPSTNLGLLAAWVCCPFVGSSL